MPIYSASVGHTNDVYIWRSLGETDSIMETIGLPEIRTFVAPLNRNGFSESGKPLGQAKCMTCDAPHPAVPLTPYRDPFAAPTVPPPI
jgi:hypothetical protein